MVPSLTQEHIITIDELRSRLTEIADRLAEIDKEYSGKRFSAEAKTEWNALFAERDETTALIAELETRQSQLTDAADTPLANREAGTSFHTRRAGTATGDDIYDLSSYRARSASPEQERDLLRDGAMRAVEMAKFPHERANREDVQTHVANLLEKHGATDGGVLARHILATGSPVYKRAFGKALVGAPLTDAETRALGSAGASGGYAVPFIVDPTIIPTSNGVVNPLRQISRIETISGADTWKGISSGAVVASRDAEATEVSDDTPTLAQPTATVTKASAFVPFTDEIGADWVSLQSEMARLIQDAKDTEEATSFTTGVGTGVNPQGIITGATGTIAAGTAAFAVAHLYALQEALPPRFEPNARFLAHNTQFNRVRQLDTTGGANMWVRLPDGQPPQLLGYPAHKLSTMDSVLTAGSEIMVFGDFWYFLIVDRLGLTVELIPHLFGASGRPTGQRGIYANWRNTSKVLSAAAFKVLSTT